MGFGFLGSATDVLLQRSLDAAATRHETISENIANVDTPGYKRGEVQFESLLKQAVSEASSVPRLGLARTNAGHLAGTQGGVADVHPSVYRVTETTGRADGNNVDVDQEMSKLGENTVLYNSITQLLGRRIGMIRSAISEGKR